MRSLSVDALAAIASGNIALATLVKIEHPGGTIVLNSSNMDLAWNGDTYLAGHGLGEIAPITDRPGELPGMSFTLHQIDAEMVSLALDDADEVQGSPVTVWTAILDSTNYQILEVEKDWEGKADTMPISEDGQKATIGLTAESKALDLLRGQSLLYTDGDQRQLYPGDRAFQYVVNQAAQPVVWPARQWFYK